MKLNFILKSALTGNQIMFWKNILLTFFILMTYNTTILIKVRKELNFIILHITKETKIIMRII